MLVEVLPPESLAIIDPAEVARQTVVQLLDDIRDHEYELAANYARLGAVLFDIRRNQYWDKWGYLSFGSYIRELADRVQKERSQLYAYIGVAEKLLPEVDEHTLVAIGITKAGELKRFVSQSGRRIPEKLLQVALDDKRTAKELRAAVLEELHQAPDPAGKYYEIGGFFCTPDEKAEIDLSIRIAKGLDPAIPNNIPEHMQMKEVMLRWAREFIATWQEAFERGGA